MPPPSGISEDPPPSFETVEAQHRELHAICDELQQRAGAELLPPFRVFAALLKVHFRDEEAFMEGIGYPQLSGHKWQHETVLADVAAVLARIDAGGDPPADSIRELIHMALDHTEHTDADLIAFHGRRGARH